MQDTEHVCGDFTFALEKCYRLGLNLTKSQLVLRKVLKRSFH